MKRRLFAHFNECVITKCETPTAFIMTSLLNHKRLTMMARQFYKQAPFNFY